MDIREAGRQGGLARAKKMTKRERSESARTAALAMHAKKKLNWSHILNDHCPKDGSKLIQKEAGYECSLSDANPQQCRFFISNEARTKLIAKMIKKPI